MLIMTELLAHRHLSRADAFSPDSSAPHCSAQHPA